MDWHNLKVMSLYAVIVCVFLLILGLVKYALIALVVYFLYGLIECIIQNNKKKKLQKDFENVSENIKEITICHIVKRNPKLKNSVVQRIKRDIIDGNFQTKTFSLTEKIAIADEDPDGGFDYYLTFNNTDKYRVRSIVYDNANKGDTLWIITTPTDEIKVIRSENDYFNMFTY